MIIFVQSSSQLPCTNTLTFFLCSLACKENILFNTINLWTLEFILEFCISPTTVYIDLAMTALFTSSWIIQLLCTWQILIQIWGSRQFHVCSVVHVVCNIYGFTHQILKVKVCIPWGEIARGSLSFPSRLPQLTPCTVMLYS